MMRVNLFLILIACFFFNISTIIGQCLDNACNGPGEDLVADWSLANESTIVCEGFPFEVQNDTDPSGIDYYVWDWGDGNRDTVTDNGNQFHTYEETGNTSCTEISELFLIALEVYRECSEGISCHTQLAPVSVSFLPIASFDDPPLICEDVPLVFTNNSCRALEYLWEFGDGETSDLISPSHTFLNPGTYEVTLTATNGCGSDITMEEITVIGFPQADAVYDLDPATGCTNLDVSFDNVIPDNADFSSATWQIFPAQGWTYSDTIFNATSWDNGITFFQPGIYGIQLTVENICGIATWTDSIEVFQAPSAILNDPMNGCIETPGQTVVIDFAQHYELTNGSSCGYQWEITNTTTSTVYNSTEEFPVFTFDEVGAYEVELIVDGCNCGDLPLSADFEIQTPTDLSFDIPSAVLCSNSDPIDITPSVEGGIWSGSPAINNEGTFFPALAMIGNNTINYSVGSGACLSQGTVMITVSEAPTVSIDETPTFCDSIEYIPSVNSTGNFDTENWMLIFEDGTIENYDPSNTTSISISEVGSYEFIVELSGDCSPVNDTLAIEIIASVSSVDAGANDTLCIVEQTYTLNGSPSGGIWQEVGGANGLGLVDSTGVLDLALAGGGTHQYEYIQAQGTECEISDIVTIEIIDFSGVNAGLDIEVCENASAFNLTGSPAMQGEWSGTGVDANGLFNPIGLAPGTYTLSYCLSNPSINCSACDEMDVMINALPNADFQINGTNCVGESLNLENLSTNACSYFWDFGNGETSTLPAPSPVYNTIGSYNITLIANSCESCQDTIVFPIVVTEPAVPQFAQDVTQGCAVLDVLFTNQSTGSDLSFLWDFGNGQTSTEQSPGIISFDQGNSDTTYQVVLAVTNGCGTVEYQSSVTVFPLPIVVFGTNVDDGCSPLEIEFSNISVGNPETYHWYIDGVLVGSDSIFQNQVFTTSDTAITNYEITLIADNFCGSDTLTNQIMVFPPDVDAFLSVDTTSGCQPLTVNFSNFSTPGAQITWDFGDGNGSFETNPIHTFEEAGTYTVYQYATNCGTDTDSIIIEVLPAPEVSFETEETFVCDGQGMTFINTSIGLDGSEWDFGDGNVSLLDSPTHIFTGPGVYTVTLTGYSSLNNCPASFERVITVLGNPDISFVPSTLNGCAPLSIDFNNTSVGAVFYEWDFGNGEVSNEENPQDQVFVDPGTYEVSLIGRDQFGCFADTSIINVLVFDKPDSEFITNTNEYCAGVDFIETTNLSQGANQYFWTFGNGLPIEEFEPTQIIPDTGALVITLIAENGFSCRDTSDTQVQILGTPIAFAPTSEFEGCAALSVQFGNASEFANEFLWIFDEGNNTSTDPSPAYTYTSPGTYMASMIAMNTNGCPNDTLLVEVMVNPNPISDFSLVENTVCGFSDSIFVINNSSGATDYDWNFDNGMNSSLFEPFGIYTDTGVYEISLITTNQFSCQDTFVQSLNILGQPMADIISSDTEGCQPALFDFTNGSAYFDSFEWVFGDGNISSTISNPNHVYLEAGTYQVQLIVNNSNDCPSDSTTLAIIVHPKPVSDFELSETLICGLSNTVETTNFSIGADNYFWNFGNGTNSTLTNPSVNYQTPDEYTISLIASNVFTCSDTMEQQVSVNLQPTANFSPRPFVGCEPDTVSFVNLATDADGWLWDYGDGTVSDVFEENHIYPSAGIYTVQLIAAYNESCFDTLNIENAVNILPSPIAAFSYTDMEDGKIQFNNESIDAIDYEWDFGNGDFSEEFSPFYEYDDNGNWQVVLTAIHQNDCTDTDTVSVSPNVFFGLHLPNAMSPESGEGDVRVFKPAGIGIESYTVEVYAPWGQLLWTNSELDGEQPKGSWDGTFKGKIVPQGAYVWKAEAEYINGIRQVQTGTVTVLR